MIKNFIHYFNDASPAYGVGTFFQIFASKTETSITIISHYHQNKFCNIGHNEYQSSTLQWAWIFFQI
jgi:hypothetical protein